MGHLFRWDGQRTIPVLMSTTSATVKDGCHSVRSGTGPKGKGSPPIPLAIEKGEGCRSRHSAFQGIEDCMAENPVTPAADPFAAKRTVMRDEFFGKLFLLGGWPG